MFNNLFAMKKSVYWLAIAFFACTFFMGIAQSKPLTSSMLISEKPFGKTPSHEDVTLYTLKNTQGMEVQIMNYGAIITKIIVPDKNKVMEDVVLGFDKVDDYIKDSPYFGAVVGRYGNRIAAGKFSLDGKIIPWPPKIMVSTSMEVSRVSIKGFGKPLRKLQIASHLPTSPKMGKKDSQEIYRYKSPTA